MVFREVSAGLDTWGRRLGARTGEDAACVEVDG